MRDAEQSKVFTRRAVLIGGGQFLLFSILFTKMVYLQIIEGKKYKRLSNRNYLKIRLIPAARGKILDQFGVVLADNIDSYNVFLIPETAFKEIDKDSFIFNLKSILNLSDDDIQKINRNISQNKKFSPVLIKENLNWKEMSKIQAKSLNFPGVFVEKGELRIYPKKEICAHITGYVGRVSQEDMKHSDDPLLSIPNFRIGKTWFEKSFDNSLKGHNGTQVNVVNSTGRIIETLNDKSTKPVAGNDIILTIDNRLQEYAYQILSTQNSASVVVMDIYTGEVLCLVSHPSYDPNLFNTEPNEKKFLKLINNKYYPFMNKAIEGLYAPGSTFKPIVLLTGLENNDITYNTRFNCKEHIEYAGHRYHCWKAGGHGWVDAINSLKHSCDIYYYELALRTGIDKIREMAYKFGFESKTGITLSHEKAGQVPGREWKQEHKHEMWYHGDSIVASIGQGFTLVTPIQLAVMTARIANGGYAVKPTILKDKTDDRVIRKPNELLKTDILFPDMEINPKNLEIVQKGMYSVVNGLNATGNSAYFVYKNKRMAGKTGTSQVARITMEERKRGIRRQEDIPWIRRHHGLFVGYAPYVNPRFAISIVVEHGISGGYAAPLAKDIMLKTLQLYL